MRLNEKNVASFAVCSSPVDKEGYLQKKGDLNRDFQRRWFVLKGNLLFYFLKKQDREPQGVIVLEACSVQVSIHGRYCFEISFDGTGTRVYILGADNNEEMESWMKAISHASYEYLKSIVDELQRRVDLLSSSSSPQSDASGMGRLKIGAVATAASSASPKPISTPGETMLTLQDLSNPMAPMQHQKYSSPATTTTKVKKGILVDVSVDDEAPPIPAKKKSMTMHASGQRTGSGINDSTYTERLLRHQTELSSEDQMDAAMLSEAPLYSTTSTHGHSALKTMKSLPPPTHPSPFSSPLVPNAPLENMDKPLSPPATLDRTPILQPSPMHANDTSNYTSLDLETAVENHIVIGELQDRHPTTSTNTTHNMSSGMGVPVGGATMPSSHPPQASSRKLAAPLDPGKSFMEMHQDFTQAMKTLNAERTSSNYTPP